ncbi:MAG: aminopeptidase P family protein [Thermaerobacter sp.]
MAGDAPVMTDFAARRRRVRDALAGAGVDALAVAPGDNMTYLLGYHPHPDERPCFLIIAARGEGMLVPALNAEEVRAHVDLPMETYTDAEGPAAALDRLAAALGIRPARAVMIEEPMRADFALLLQERLGGAVLRLAGPVLAAMRMRKDPGEIEALQRAARLGDAAMQAAFAALRPGMTELELARVVEEAFMNGGAQSVSFAIVASGPNAAFPHHQSGSRVVQAGEPVLFDIGARLDNYECDITRMAFVGEPNDEYLKVHGIVERAVQAALAVIRPGVEARQVDLAARSVIEEAGYGPYFTHRTGHGIGISGHEPPSITSTNDMPLDVGMAFSVEPGIYLPGRFGVRLEEIVVVTETGCRVLSGLSRDVRVVR